MSVSPRGGTEVNKVCQQPQDSTVGQGTVQPGPMMEIGEILE